MYSFLEVFADKIGQDINLSDAATSLEVERRRIYDIVNVFESLEVVRRKAKNIYIYQGLVNLDATLGKLKVQPWSLAHCIDHAHPFWQALAHSQIDSPRKSKANVVLQVFFLAAHGGASLTSTFGIGNSLEAKVGPLPGRAHPAFHHDVHGVTGTLLVILPLPHQLMQGLS